MGNTTKHLVYCRGQTGQRTVVNRLVEEQLSGATQWSEGIWENITRWRMWSWALNIHWNKLFFWHFWCKFPKIACGPHSSIRTKLLIFKRENARDRLLLVIGHHCLLCSFPWKIAVEKASYFRHYISDLHKHLRIHLLCLSMNISVCTCNTKMLTCYWQGYNQQ